MPARRQVFPLVVALLALSACSGDDADGPEAAPHGPPAVIPDPCGFVDAAEVGAIVGDDVDELGPEGGEIIQVCGFGLADGGEVEVAVVSLAALADTGERVTGDAYIADLAEGAGAGEVSMLDGVGDGDAITIAYEFGSQAWAWRRTLVVGAYATHVPDASDVAVALLRAAVAGAEKRL